MADAKHGGKTPWMDDQEEDEARWSSPKWRFLWFKLRCFETEREGYQAHCLHFREMGLLSTDCRLRGPEKGRRSAKMKRKQGSLTLRASLVAGESRNYLPGQQGPSFKQQQAG